MSGKLSLNWRKKCKRIKRYGERGYEKDVYITIKNRFMIAVVVRALVHAYLCNDEVYLYCLLVIQNLLLDSE
jgi:hypothetical protein